MYNGLLVLLERQERKGQTKQKVGLENNTTSTTSLYEYACTHVKLTQHQVTQQIQLTFLLA